MENHPSPAAPAAGPVPIAIVGLGFGRWIVKALLETDLRQRFRLVALCDLNGDLAASMSRDTGVRTASLEELLADPDVPAIGLFTGPVGRAGLLRKIIRAGKHVMTTKPFERDVAAARVILEEARALGRVIHINSPAPVLTDDMRRIAAWREQYDLGRPLAAQGSTWVRYNEEADGRWLDDPAQCPVAPIFRIGIYLINDLVTIFGDASEVQVMSSRFFTKRPTPDHAMLGIKFRNGGLANVLASFCIDDGDRYRNRLQLNFENGTVYRNSRPRSAGNPPELILAIKDGEGTREVERVQPTEISGNYPWETFYASVTSAASGSPEVFTDPEKVCAGLRIIEAMARAETEGVVRIE